MRCFSHISLQSRAIFLDVKTHFLQGITHNYTYDYLHRRIISNQTKHYLYDDKDEIGCTNENLKITQLRVLGIGQGAEIGASIAIEIDNTVYAPLHDLYGNIKALIDQEGNICEFYNYDSFGQHNLAQGTWAGNYLPQSDTVNSPWRYQSKRLDPTDFVYFGRRYYMPELGRFLTPDPLGLSEGPNLYQYLHNSPLLNYDEYGLMMMYGQPLKFQDFAPIIQGGSQMMLGASEVTTGMGLTFISGGTATFAGGLLVVHGLDQMLAGARTAFTGQFTNSATVQAL